MKEMTTRSLVGAIALAVPTLALLSAPLLPVLAGAAVASFLVLRRPARPGAGV
ncbi:hypothetical protein KGQ64_02955 [bacterium]|nr:hypothetical protein [bacterium]